MIYKHFGGKCRFSKEQRETAKETNKCVYCDNPLRTPNKTVKQYYVCQKCDALSQYKVKTEKGLEPLTTPLLKTLWQNKNCKCENCNDTILFDDTTGKGLASGSGSKYLAVDHDHTVKPKTMRGILCQYCNIHLGFYEKFKRHPEWISNFENYLTTHKG